MYESLQDFIIISYETVKNCDDAYMTIAAASILAKHSRDEYIRLIYVEVYVICVRVCVHMYLEVEVKVYCRRVEVILEIRVF